MTVYFKELLNNFVGIQLFVVKSGQQKQYEQWVNQKSSYVEGEQISVGKLSF
jgi:hypothetical protein